MTIRFLDGACNTVREFILQGENGEFSTANVYVGRLENAPRGYILEVGSGDDSGIVAWFGEGERFADAEDALTALYGHQR